MAMFSVDKNLFSVIINKKENCRKQTDWMIKQQMKFKVDKCKVACVRKTILTLQTL